MVVETINDYLQSNRRLVIPSFGAFVVKESGEMLFSELLKTDDGVLRGLLVSKGLREIEAAGIIDRFIFEVRHALQESGICPIIGLGTFRRDAEGIITFDSTKPAVVAIPVKPVQTVTPSQTAQSQPTVQVQTPQSAPHPASVPPHRRAAASRPVAKRSGGGIMWFAGIVILGALIALGYGIYCMATAPDRDLDAQMDAQRIPMIEVPTTSDK